MSLLNKLFGKKSNDYTTKLANIIIKEYWTKDKNQAIAFADTLILNMGFIKAEEYIISSSKRYKDSSIKILAIIKATADGQKNIQKDLYYAVASTLTTDMNDLMQQLIEDIDDLTKLTFKWGDIKEIFIKEIKILYPTFQNETYDEMSETFMDYLCFNIQIKNGQN